MNLCYDEINFDSTGNGIASFGPCVQVVIKCVSSCPNCFCGYHSIDVTEHQDSHVGRKTFIDNPLQLLVWDKIKYFW